MDLLNYNVLSLKDMVIRRLVSVLFKESDILESVRSFRTTSSSLDGGIKFWQETVEDKMSDKISKLGLPKLLLKLVIDTVKPMVRQVKAWKAGHEKYLQVCNPFGVPVLERLRWTAAGALDYRKTAEELIHSDVIDIVGRYKLACLYCLEDYIPLLWQELPRESKILFYIRNRHLEDGFLLLPLCWPYIIRGEQSKLDYEVRFYRRVPISFHQFAFQKSALIPNKAATEYFYHKLTQEEKEDSLITTAQELLSSRHERKEKASEVLHYLLSVMTPDQQMRIFQEESRLVLKCFANWPLQDLFSEIARLVWNFLPPSEYDDVLRDMYESSANSGHYFQALIQELLLRIPYDLRKDFVCHSRLLYHILSLEDKEALETILSNVDAASRKALVFSKEFFSHSFFSIISGSWDIVEACLRAARLSKEDRERLKEAFTRYLTPTKRRGMELGKWARFFQLLDETDASSERCSDDETPTEAEMKKP